jgi:hypothetical protein
VLADGSHSLTAQFIPTDPTAFTGSTSPIVSYTVSAPTAVTTTTTLTVLPASPVNAGTTVTMTGQVSPGTAVGQVQFFDGATMIGSGTV